VAFLFALLCLSFGPLRYPALFLCFSSWVCLFWLFSLFRLRCFALLALFAALFVLLFVFVFFGALFYMFVFFPRTLVCWFPAFLLGLLGFSLFVFYLPFFCSIVPCSFFQ
jgi:hypothetical protein